MLLSTQYLGLNLNNPLILGASPLTADIDAIKRIVDAGASAIVMHSLFEEQLTRDAMPHPKHSGRDQRDSAPPLSMQTSTPEAHDLPPSSEYLEQLVNLKRNVNVPVIASLNGASDQGWLHYARQLESAGADALELNVYHLTMDPEQSAADVEQHLLNMVHVVTQAVRIPVAIKLSPFYSALPYLARRLIHEGARGLVMFNRFYEPDIDVEALALEPKLRLSDSNELTLRLRWTAALSPKIAGSIAISGGVHTSLDVVKSIMAGAHAVQIVSAVLKQGPSVFREIERDLENWLKEHQYASLKQAQGCMNLARCPDPTLYQRGNYLKTLQSF